MDKIRLVQSSDADGRPSDLEPGDPLGDAINYWERRRIVYNGILVLIFLGWIVLTWPHFGGVLSAQSVIFLLFFGAMANLFYSAVYLVDIPAQLSPLRTAWRRWRIGLWLIGTLLAILFTNYWIADEIYPYVR
jgi:hypothetical protein